MSGSHCLGWTGWRRIVGLPMSDRIVAVGRNPSPGRAVPDPGAKARDLIALRDRSADGAFRVPSFEVLEGFHSAAFHVAHGQPRFRYADDAVPDSDAVAAPVWKHYSALGDSSADSVLAAAAGLGGIDNVWLRSSLVVPGSVGAGAGINHTISACGGGLGHTAGLKKRLTTLAASTWKAYNAWYWRLHQLPDQRDFCAVASASVDSELVGTATVLGGTMHVDFEYKRSPIARQGVTARLDHSGAVDIFGDRSRDRRLLNAVRAVTQTFDAAPAREIEFGFDTQDQLYLFQQRKLPTQTDDRGRPRYGTSFGLHHSPGSTVGPVVSLLDVARDRASIESAVARCPTDTILLVHDRSADFADAFALLWAQSFWWQCEPLRLVLCFRTKRAQRHLTTTVHEDPGVEALYQMDVRDAIRLSGQTVRFDSDGLGCVVTRLSPPRRRHVRAN
jgi:hypothetical protein